MQRNRQQSGLAICLALWAAACTQGSPGASGSATSSGDQKRNGKDQEPPPDDPIQRDVHSRALQYAQYMSPKGAYTSGSLEEGQRRDHLLVLTAGRCYRIVAAGGGQVVDLDLSLFAPAGTPVQQDNSEDPFPMLGMTSDLCPGEAGAFRLQVTMFKGAGHYAYRLYASGD